MYKKLSFKKTVFLFSFVLSLIIVCGSCSNTVPDINNAKLSIIFDYESYEALPTARLSVFVEAASNPRRFESIYVSSNQSELVWESNNLVLAENEEIKYCGLTNLVMPQKEIIPTGEYTITFTQFDEEKKEIKTTLNYDKELYNTKGSDVPKVMSRFTYLKMITIYDSEKKVLYYGPRTMEMADSRGIWNQYRDAAEFQESWMNANSTIICNMPLEKVVPGN